MFSRVILHEEFESAIRIFIGWIARKIIGGICVYLCNKKSHIIADIKPSKNSYLSTKFQVFSFVEIRLIKSFKVSRQHNFLYLDL